MSDTETLPIIKPGQGRTISDIESEVRASAVVLLILILFIAGCVIARVWQ